MIKPRVCDTVRARDLCRAARPFALSSRVCILHVCTLSA
jgi:hypothetical protein